MSKEVKAILRNLRISPRKVRLVADMIRTLKIEQAIEQLMISKKQAAQPMLKLLNSAIANAKNNFQIQEDNLKIKEILVNQGSVLKRFTPRAFGRATTIRKRMSHVKVVLEDATYQHPKVEGEVPKQKSEKAKNSNERKIFEKNVDQEKTFPNKEQKIDVSSEEPKKNVDPRMQGKERHIKNDVKKKKKNINT